MTKKYQFFYMSDSDRRDFTYLDMSSTTFVADKDILISQGFEVGDDIIYAENSSKAVAKFKSDTLFAQQDNVVLTKPRFSFLKNIKWLKNKPEH